MASLLDALGKGAIKTTTGAARSAKEAALGQFDPRGAIYGLGMGVGPIIRQTVAEYKKQQKDSSKDNEVQQTKQLNNISKTSETGNIELRKAVAQLGQMNSVLQELRKISIAQLQAQVKATKAGKGSKTQYGGAFRNKPQASVIQYGSKTADLQSPKADTESANNTKSENGGFNLGDMLGGGLKALLGGMIAKELWQSLAPDTKKEVKSVLSVIGETVVDTVGAMYKAAWAASPTATVVGTALGAAKLGQMAQVPAMYKAMKFVTSPAPTVAGATAAGAAGAAAANTPVPTATPSATTTTATAPTNLETRAQRRALEMEKYQEFKNQGMKPGEAREAAKDFVQQARKAPAPTVVPVETPTATGAAKAAQTAETFGGKAARYGSTALKYGGRALGALGVVGSGLSAKENYEKGNNKLAALDAFAATTGALAVGSAVTGFGLPVAAALGTASMIAGGLSLAGSMFVDNEETTKTKPLETPAGDKGGRGLTPEEIAKLKFVPQHVLNDAPFMQAVEQVAKKHGLKVEDLMAVMKAENDTFDPSRKNPRSNATGLIQFMPGTAADLHTTTAALAKMSRAEQMKYVDAYFTKVGLPHGANRETLWTSILRPASLKDKNNVLYRAGTNEFYQNRELSSNGSDITVADLSARLDRVTGSTSKSGNISSASDTTIAANSLKGLGLTSNQTQTLMGAQDVLKDMTELFNLFEGSTSSVNPNAGPTTVASAAPSGGNSNKTPPSVPPVSMYKEKHSFGQTLPWYKSGGMMTS